VGEREEIQTGPKEIYLDAAKWVTCLGKHSRNGIQNSKRIIGREKNKKNMKSLWDRKKGEKQRFFAGPGAGKKKEKKFVDKFCQKWSGRGGRSDATGQGLEGWAGQGAGKRGARGNWSVTACKGERIRGEVAREASRALGSLGEKDSRGLAINQCARCGGEVNVSVDHGEKKPPCGRRGGSWNRVSFGQVGRFTRKGGNKTENRHGEKFREREVY